MNPLPDSTFWLRALGGLALQVTVLLASAGLIAFKLRTARGQRAAWLTAVIATGLLQVAGFFGADRQLAAWFEPKPTPERVFRIRTNVPVASKSAAWLNASSDLTLTGARPELNVAPPATLPQSVWWPAWLWLTGIGALLGQRGLWRSAFAWWWRGRQAPASAEIEAHVAEVARRLGVRRRIRVVVSPALVCPIAFGVLRPTVGLPANFATAHGTREREAMLAHEVAHLSARDPLWLGLADFVIALLWWHPLVWWARRQLRAACETAADEASVLVEDGPAVLANCLVTLAGQLPRRRAFGLLGMAGFRSDLGRRVERLLALRNRGLRPTARGRLVFATIGGGAVAVALALASAAWALPRNVGEPPSLFALANQALVATAASATDPTPAPASTPNSPTELTPAPKSNAEADSPWQATLLVELPKSSESGQSVSLGTCADALVRRLYATRDFTAIQCEPVQPDRVSIRLSLHNTNTMDSLKALVEQCGKLEFRVVHPENDRLIASNECPTGYRVLTQSLGTDRPAQRLVVTQSPIDGLSSSNIAKAAVVRDSLTDQPRVSITLDEAGRLRFAELTRTNIDRQIAVLLDGKLLMAPVVREPITGGKCEITGSDFAQTATVLAASLQVPLPAKLKLLDATVVAPAKPGGASTANPTAKPVEPTHRVAIQVNADGRILFADQEIALNDLAAKLAQAKTGTPELVVSLTAETDAPMNRLVEVLDQCRGAGVTRITLKTIGAAQPATKAPPASSTRQPAQSDAADQSVRVAALVQDAKLLYELGKLDEAKAKLETALTLDPGSQLAADYLNLVRDALARKPATTGAVSGEAAQAATKAPSIASNATPGAAETDGGQLLTRVFKLNPNTFQQGLSAVAGNVPTNQPPVQLLRSFFAAVGLDFGGANSFVGGTNANAFQSPAGKAVFYNDRNGMLLVRATRRDLDAVETALQMLNATPPQVVIEAKFVEITQDDSKALGFDWYLGNFVMGTNGSTNPTAGTAPSFSGAPSTANPQGVFPGPVAALRGSATNRGTLTGLMTDPQFRSVVEALQRGGTNGVHDLRGDELDWPGRQATNAHNVRVTAALGATVTGVLTDPQYRVVLRALEQRSGAEVLSAPRVTTLSGRQAQIQVVDMRTAVTGIDPSALIQNGAQPKTNAVPFLTSTFPVGPTLDVIPTVAADGYTIELNLVASITEFLGYDQPPADAKVTVWEGGKASEVAMPLPRFRVRQMTTKAVLWDGQTLVLAGMPVEDSVTMKDKVPVLGDLPAVGSLFRSESKSTRKKNLLVFITATIIDPAGNRVHSADNPPYDPNKIPPQSPR